LGVELEVPPMPRRKVTKKQGSQISDESVPGTRLFILGTGPENRELLWHGGYCHACVLLTDHNLRSDASKRTRISRGLLGVHSRYGLHTSHMTESRHAHAGVDVAINHRRRPVIP
jgi:hypothetical protein